MRIGRRTFITLLGGGAAAWPLAGRAQQPGPVRRIGVLMNGAATEGDQQSYLAAFVQGLRESGWTEGRNLRLDIRWSAGDAGLARIYAAQLVGLIPDVILASSTTNLTVIQQATSTVPVVFVQVSDPVAQGFVGSVAKPGGNITGFAMYEFSIGSKWLGLLKEIAPGLARIGIMFNPDTSPQSKFFMRAIGAAAPSIGIEAIAVPVRAAVDIEPALERLGRLQNGGLILPTDSFTRLHETLIIELAGRHRLPSMATNAIFVKNGGLMYYGANINFFGQFRDAAAYVDRILKGAKPADLPVQLPTRFELVINRKTADALGLTVPLTLLATADQLIE
jgi:putative ABC transport system substrate-binding protein